MAHRDSQYLSLTHKNERVGHDARKPTMSLFKSLGQMLVSVVMSMTPKTPSMFLRLQLIPT